MSVYPGSAPEFRMFERRDGTVQMQVRYINAAQGYESKWMDVKTEKESDMKDQFGSGGGVAYYDFFFTKDGKPTLRRRVSAPYNLGE